MCPQAPQAKPKQRIIDGHQDGHQIQKTRFFIGAHLLEAKMSELTDIQIKAWIRNDECFEQRGDGGGLFLSYRKEFATPVWRFRYRFAGQRKAMLLGSYSDLSLAEARRQTKELRARVPLGYDVAAGSIPTLSDQGSRKTLSPISARYRSKM